jgi:hypothetical protein
LELSLRISTIPKILVKWSWLLKRFNKNSATPGRFLPPV